MFEGMHAKRDVDLGTTICEQIKGRWVMGHTKASCAGLIPMGQFHDETKFLTILEAKSEGGSDAGRSLSSFHILESANENSDKESNPHRRIRLTMAQHKPESDSTERFHKRK